MNLMFKVGDTWVSILDSHSFANPSYGHDLDIHYFQDYDQHTQCSKCSSKLTGKMPHYYECQALLSKSNPYLEGPTGAHWTSLTDRLDLLLSADSTE